MTAATITLHGSTVNITFVPVITWTSGPKGPGTWYHPGQPGYRYSTWSRRTCGHRDVTAEIDTFYAVSAGSAQAGAGMW